MEIEEALYRVKQGKMQEFPAEFSENALLFFIQRCDNEIEIYEEQIRERNHIMKGIAAETSVFCREVLDYGTGFLELFGSGEHLEKVDFNSFRKGKN
jgi:hypothetical protein